ncbi:MAG: tetratricopeptide repeat protein [Campylobacterales bacterium]
MLEFLQPEVLVLILGPTLFFAYLVLTNASLLQRNFSLSMLKNLQERKGMSKNFKNTLLLLSAIMLIIAYSRPALVKKVDQNTQIKKDASIIIIEQKSNQGSLNQAIDIYKEAKYSITTYLLSSDLYLIYPKSRDYRFLEETLKRLSLYEYKKEPPDMQKIEALKERFDSVYIVGVSTLPSLETPSSSDFFLNIDELYIYPLIVGVVLFFVAIFIPFTLKMKLLFILLLFLPQKHLEAGLFDFYYLDRAYESYEIGNYKEALKSFEMVDKNRVHYNKGNCYYKLGEYEKALESYKKFKPKSKQEKFYKAYNEANCYFLLDKRDEAIKLYKDALKIEDNPKAKINLELSQQNQEPLKTKKRKKIPLLKID